MNILKINLFLIFIFLSENTKAEECIDEILDKRIVCQINYQKNNNFELSDFVSFFENHVIAYLQFDNQQKIKVWVRPPLLSQRVVQNGDVLRLSCQNKIKHMTKNGFMCEILFTKQKEWKIYIDNNGQIDKRIIITGFES